jgi:hypothetical protein
LHLPQIFRHTGVNQFEITTLSSDLGQKNQGMKRTILVWLIQLITMPTLAQADHFRKNNIAFETGIWSRGIIGFSYSRHYLPGDFFYLSSEVSAGLGSGWDYIHAYQTFTQSVYLGSKEVYALIGAELRHYSLSTGGFLFETGHRYEGITGSPVVGFGCTGLKGFTFRTRLSALLVFENRTLEFARPSVGLSFGYTF